MERAIPLIFWIFPFLSFAIGIYMGTKAWPQYRNPTNTESLVFGKSRWKYDILQRWTLNLFGLDPEHNKDDPKFIRAVAIGDLMNSVAAILLGLFMLALFSGVIDSRIFDF
ncbi:MAG: hypothetical protein GY759_14170 [Chloroflexi bacterium]|nr:hypothetical protein [Chloroflexota bacterium]